MQLLLVSFSPLKSFYPIFSAPEEDPPPNPLFQKVWKWEGPACMKSILWKFAYGKLLTNEERKKRGTSANNTCPRCNLYP